MRGDSPTSPSAKSKARKPKNLRKPSKPNGSGQAEDPSGSRETEAPAPEKRAFVMPQEMRSGVDILRQVAMLIQDGDPMYGPEQARIVGMLADIQPQAELAHVAQIPLIIGRLTRITGLIAKAEGQLEEVLDSPYPMDPKDLVACLKALYGESGAIREVLRVNSTRPLVTNPDGLARIVSPAVDPVSSDHTPEGRRRIMVAVDQIRKMVAERATAAVLEVREVREVQEVKEASVTN